MFSSLFSTETGGTKRKGPPRPGLPARKKPRKKTEPLDEDTMVALALSSALLEQERESERALQTETATSHISMTPVLKWRPDRGTVTSVLVNTNKGFLKRHLLYIQLLLSNILKLLQM